MSYPRAVLITWLLAFLLALLLVYDMAHAEGWTVQGGIGQSIFQPTAQDGLWHQQSLPHAFDLHDTAYKVAVGYEWAHWAVSGAVVGLGSIKVKDAGFVGDEHYDPKAHICLATCDKLSWLQGSDSVRAYQLTGKYIWHAQNWHPFIELGAALLTHRLTVTNSGSYQELYGRMPAMVVGGGVCYGERWQLCPEVSYYNVISGVSWFGNSQYPMFENVFVSLLSLKYTFGGF